MHIRDLPSLNRRQWNPTNMELGDLEEMLERWKGRGKVILEPEFQRNNTMYSEEEQRALIEYILRGGGMFIPPIMFSVIGFSVKFRHVTYLVDGLQRITALLKFLRNDLSVFNGHFYKDIDGADRCEIQYVRIEDLSYLGMVDLYLEMNSKRVPHSESDIQKAIYHREKVLSGEFNPINRLQEL